MRVHRSTGRTVRARLAVVALPPPLSGRIRFSPALPTDRDQLSQRTANGRVIKVNVVYDRPFWREAGLSGQAFGNKQSLGVVFDNSPADGTAGVLVGFFDAGHADVCSRMEPAERRALALDRLVRYFGPEAGNQVCAYLERDWTAEEFSGGCYHSFPTPGALTRFGPALRDVVGRCTGPAPRPRRPGPASWTARSEIGKPCGSRGDRCDLRSCEGLAAARRRQHRRGVLADPATDPGRHLGDERAEPVRAGRAPAVEPETGRVEGEPVGVQLGRGAVDQGTVPSSEVRRSSDQNSRS